MSAPSPFRSLDPSTSALGYVSAVCSFRGVSYLGTACPCEHSLGGSLKRLSSVWFFQPTLSSLAPRLVPRNTSTENWDWSARIASRRGLARRVLMGLPCFDSSCPSWVGCLKQRQTSVCCYSTTHCSILMARLLTRLDLSFGTGSSGRTGLARYCA
jgi:hypothetical protein